MASQMYWHEEQLDKTREVMEQATVALWSQAAGTSCDGEHLLSGKAALCLRLEAAPACAALLLPSGPSSAPGFLTLAVKN